MTADLIEVVQVLQGMTMSQVDTVCDTIAEHVPSHQMHQVPALTTVRTEGERVHPLGLAESVKRVDIRPEVVQLVCMVYASYPISLILFYVIPLIT